MATELNNLWTVPTTPEDVNFLQNVDFVFKLTRTPHVNYFCSDVFIPGVTGIPIRMPTPFGVNYPVESNKIVYDNLSITFKVDQQMNNYLELYEWMFALYKPESFQEFITLFGKTPNTEAGINKTKLPKASDGGIFVLDNLKQPKFEVLFKNLQPIALSQIPISTGQIDQMYMIVTAFFSFDFFKINPII